MDVAQKAFVIYSIYTGAPYIDEKRNSYVFEDEGRAKKLAEKIPGAKVDVKEYGGKRLVSLCCAAGAKMIRNDRGILEVTERNTERRFYNGQLNADITRYVHTKNRQYLADLKNCSFIVPIKIRNHPSVSAEYAAAAREGKPWNFLAFTDMDEYNKWPLSREPEWSPLKVDFGTLRRIGRKHGFVLNVRGMGLVLTRQMLREIDKGKREEK